MPTTARDREFEYEYDHYGQPICASHKRECCEECEFFSLFHESLQTVRVREDEDEVREEEEEEVYEFEIEFEEDSTETEHDEEGEGDQCNQYDKHDKNGDDDKNEVDHKNEDDDKNKDEYENGERRVTYEWPFKGYECHQYRFLPQLDYQISGGRLDLRAGINVLEPSPRSTLKTHYCGECQVTWLVGHDGEGPAKTHPHHAARDSVPNKQPTCNGKTYHSGADYRSIIVCVSGSFDSQEQTLGHGLYFGPNSRYNVARRVDAAPGQNRQSAQVEAAVEALTKVHDDIWATLAVLARRRQANGKKSKTSKAQFRLIIATDSVTLVNAMCGPQHFNAQDQGEFLANDISAIKQDRDHLRALDHWKFELIQDCGVETWWYLISENDNSKARDLAGRTLPWQ
ncbi:hypothetical protein F4780DRAFT_795989 [Xylariomycetidae sp. FL0641]|nr:hypothetical protein F4780DRAFT_795989 [Xylariomycetidae sp. FL0641]